VDWRTRLSGAPGPHRCQPATLGKTKAHSAKIHQTVRCATGLSGEPAEQQLYSANGRLWQELQWATVSRRSQSSEVRGALDCPVGHQTVRCRKRTKPQWSTRLRTLTVGWRGGAPDTEQCLSGGAPDCPVRPSPAASPTAMEVVRGYKYPQPPHSYPSEHSKHLIQYKSKRLHSKTHQIVWILSKAPNQLNSIRDLREGVLVFFCCSYCLAWPFYFLTLTR
jgi:hypothetical protein